MDKQIEEMSDLLECIITPYVGSLISDSTLHEWSKYILKYYQPKLPEGAVVLTKWEYEYFQKEIRYWQEQYHKESENFIKFIGETFKEKRNED